LAEEGNTVTRVLHTTAGASIIVMLVLAGVALGSTSANEAATAKSLMAIKERGSGVMSPDKTFKGRFVLALMGLPKDSGTTVIHPNQGAERIVDGQQQTTVFGNDVLTSKKGTLNIGFRGIDITINNLDPTKSPSDLESGTWQIVEGSGIYKGWKGHGLWANVGTSTVNNIEWDGWVTH
jgi:hypothetical protein